MQPYLSSRQNLLHVSQTEQLQGRNAVRRVRRLQEGLHLGSNFGLLGICVGPIADLVPLCQAVMHGQLLLQLCNVLLILSDDCSGLLAHIDDEVVGYAPHALGKPVQPVQRGLWG